MRRLLRVLRPRRTIVVNQYGDALDAFDTSLWEPSNVRTITPRKGKP